MPTLEYNFDGLVGPTHNYAGLSLGNVASERQGGKPSNPKAAALQGLEKMRFVASLGAGQAVLPPQPRPSLSALRALGFHGTDEEIITRAAGEEEHLLRLCSSASAMWTANAATCAPSADTADGRLHLTPANLHQMFHRSLEAHTTEAILQAIFADEARFAVHEALPGGGQLADEGAANHTRLTTGDEAVHLFAWGRTAFGQAPAPVRYPARQTLEASRAIARLHRLRPERCVFPQQAPRGIDGGAFHTDVLAVGTRSFLMLHELAFCEPERLLTTLGGLLGEGFRWVLAAETELPTGVAVATYPFNSQLLDLPDGTLAVVAPLESRDSPKARGFLERVLAEDNPVTAVHYRDVRESMNNGGGPACLRQRIPLTDEERGAVSARVFLDDALATDLEGWISRHYRDRLVGDDVRDPALARESMAALDELTGLLRLGSVYDFQKAGA